MLLVIARKLLTAGFDFDLRFAARPLFFGRHDVGGTVYSVRILHDPSRNMTVPGQYKLLFALASELEYSAQVAVSRLRL